MKNVFAMIILMFTLFSMGREAHGQTTTTNTNPAISDCGTAGESKACLRAPAGTMKDSQKTKDFVTFMQWALFLGGAVACVIYGLKCAGKVSDEQWKESFGPGVGSFIAGSVSFIAFKFIS